MTKQASNDRRHPLTALIADADAGSCATIATALEQHGVEVQTVNSFVDARAALKAELGLLVVSSKLAGAGAVPQLLRAARRIAPLCGCVVVRGADEAPLRIKGTHELVGPLEPGVLEAHVKAAAETRAAMRDVTTLLLGRVGLKEAQRVLRSGMSAAALARCSGSRRAAAVLLGVDRRYVQKLCGQRQPKDEDAARFAAAS
jgi:DNA-binding NtrC family response regulator